MRRDIHRCGSLIISSVLHFLPLPLTTLFPSVLSLLASPLIFHLFIPLTFLSFHSLRRSSLSCIVIHFPFRFLFSCDIFSIFSPLFHSYGFCPLVFFIRYPLFCSLSLCQSSFDHLRLSSFIHLHCYSLVFHDEALESLGVPIITKSWRPDLNTWRV